MTIEELAIKAMGRDLSDAGAAEDAFAALRILEQDNKALSHELNKKIRAVSAKQAVEQKSMRFLDLNRRSLLFDAPVDFDAFCRYIEMDRQADKRFYMPRRKALLRVANSLQKLADGDLSLLAISMPPGVGKTTIAIFFLCWLAGRNPELPILGGSHSNAFLRGVYDECLRVMDKKGEYLWRDVFPELEVCRTDALNMNIDLDTPKRFATLQFSSVGSGNAGKVRAHNLLYCDDLVDGLEAALSRDRMDKLWGAYSVDLRQRKIGDCKELHIATRWSVHDVIGRLQDAYGNDDDTEFIVMPALDENDESNFDYGNDAGFTTAFYHTQRNIMDDASWRALYMNEPVEREGQLYTEAELRRYFELPDRAPDAILAACDTKDKGKDYCVMPIAYKYGQDFYIDAIICDNSTPDVVDTRLAAILYDRGVELAQFESNAAGGKTAEKVQKTVKELGGKTKITTRYNTTEKETRIIIASAFVKSHFLFKDDSILASPAEKEYRNAVKQLCGYTLVGKNKNDDVPDAFAQLADFVQTLEMRPVKIFSRPY